MPAGANIPCQVFTLSVKSASSTYGCRGRRDALTARDRDRAKPPSSRAARCQHAHRELRAAGIMSTSDGAVPVKARHCLYSVRWE